VALQSTVDQWARHDREKLTEELLREGKGLFVSYCVLEYVDYDEELYKMLVDHMEKRATGAADVGTACMKKKKKHQTLGVLRRRMKPRGTLCTSRDFS
jgi:hypothetical protein